MRMLGVSSERATQYRDQAEHFQLLATVETQPRARAQLLELGDQYRQLAIQNREDRALAHPQRERGANRPAALYAG